MVIRTASQKIRASVSFITREKAGEYGPYRSVLFIRADRQGEDAKVWRSMKPHEAEGFSKNQQVYLIATERKGKPTWDVELIDSVEATPPAQPTAQGMDPEQKREIAAYVGEMGDLWAYCLQTAQTKIGASVDGETVRCMASSLFISASRKFDLE